MENDKYNLGQIRKIIDKHLANANVEIEEKISIKSSLDLGSITYSSDDGELVGFKSRIEFKVKGKEKEPRQLKNFIKILKKEKLIKSISHFDGTFETRKGEKVKFVGLNLNKPKNCVQLIVNGKKGYQANLGYLIQVGNLNTSENREIVKAKTDSHGTPRDLVDYIDGLLFSEHYYDISV